METTFSPYLISWIEVRATKGIITKKDATKIAKWFAFSWTSIRVRGNKKAFLHFVSKDKAIEFLNKHKGELGNKYECRLFTDKQFGMIPKDTYDVPFTTKQNKEVYLI